LIYIILIKNLLNKLNELQNFIFKGLLPVLNN